MRPTGDSSREKTHKKFEKWIVTVFHGDPSTDDLSDIAANDAEFDYGTALLHFLVISISQMGIKFRTVTLTISYRDFIIHPVILITSLIQLFHLFLILITCTSIIHVFVISFIIQ